MPHENKINWGGGVQSPKDKYDLRLEVDFADPPNKVLNADFTIKHGMKGCHVARQLEKKWNATNADILAVADGPTVEFAGEVNAMKYRVDNTGSMIALPTNHSAKEVVPGLFASLD